MVEPVVPPATKRVSVIIPTRNRAALLAEVLDSLEKQTMCPTCFEVIVVDNCSTDSTAEMMAERQRRGAIDLHYVRQTENRGQIHSRNVGASKARAPILAFTDSDCRTHPNWLESAVKALESNPKAAIACGPVRDKPEQPVRFFSLPIFANEGENLTYPACNIAYRKTVFDSVGGFDESAWVGDLAEKSYGDSDTDLAWKVKRQGHPVAFVPEMLVYHEVWQVSPARWLWMQTLAFRIPGVFRQTPELRAHLLWHDPVLYRENAFLYLALAGAAAAWVSPWFLALAAPHVLACLRGPVSLRSIVKWPAMVALLTAQRVVLCSALMVGSFKFRTLII